MRLDREGRRTVAQFLNGVAVAVLATLALAPLSGGTLSTAAAICSIVGAAALHVVALLPSTPNGPKN